MLDYLTGQPASHKRKRQYRIGRHLGAGGFGEVKQATSLETGDEVAIKIIPKAKISDIPTQVTRQNSLATLVHPHIVHLREWFESRDKFYLVFELAAGGELYEHLIDVGRFGEEEAREVTYALVDAVAYLASRGVVHRDLKPENVLYRSPPGQNGAGHDDCVVSDFGLAVEIKPDQKLHVIAGSAGYSAPEMYSSDGYGFPADCWSLGVITFAMMGGRFPYRATIPTQIAEEARTTELYFPRTWEGVSEEAKDFIRKLLVVDPDHRMTAAEALHHPWLLAAKSRPASPDNEHEDPVKLPAQDDFLDPNANDEDEATTPSALERRPTFIGEGKDTRVAV
ncbi:kinase-like domain-containing protein [Leucosporidium creatinivorum]|uniref:Kinase-like domain-containing protein n=1 Tax=Leucosporidium creatinivorum TaxID=106004 RepID=A0A1Y2FU77_9BASI|nr:kinase-like domain-containing protein [Leucosporidium creatinivorum]